MSICILTKYIGALWAGKILQDWGCTTTQQPIPQTQIIISDKSIERNYPFTAFHIILTDLNISSPHLLALSGNLSTFGQKSDVFIPKMLAETAIANAIAILCLQRLFESKQTSNNQSEIYELSVIQILKYYGTFFISAKAGSLISQPRGQNLLQGGAPFYAVYACKEGHLAIGNLEPKFYQQMIKGLGLSQQEQDFWLDSQFSNDDWPKMQDMLRKNLLKKTAKEWQQHYRSYDTCITQIKSPFQSNIRQPKYYPLNAKL